MAYKYTTIERMKNMADRIYSVETYARTARKAVAEGIVMLKNTENVLPLKAGTKIALFGRSQFCYYKSGTGSGGLVNTAYVTGIKEALEGDERVILNQGLLDTYEEWLQDHPFDMGAGWAQEPWFQEEMPITRNLAEETRKESDTAVIIIGRTAGEDKDNAAREGSYLLTADEEEMLQNVCSVYERTVVLLNVGNIIDMKWVVKYDPSAVLYVWQGGQEGGNGVLDVLMGDECPSGRLSDTIAFDIEDYPSTPAFGGTLENVYIEDIYVGYRYFSTFAPEKVMYPFGFGLSYTQFEVRSSVQKAELSSGGEAVIEAKVTNIGKAAGKEVVQVYCQAPQGKLGKPARVLIAYGKTDTLQPGESQTLTLTAPVSAFASFDDTGSTGKRSCFVLEEGIYLFYAGKNVRDAVSIGSADVASLVVVEELSEAIAPVKAFNRMKPACPDEKGVYTVDWEPVPLRTVDPMEKRAKQLPTMVPFTGDQGYKLLDVEEGRVSMEQFLAQLSDEELCCMIRGEGMCSPKVTAGTAGAFGGVTERLQYFGIPAGCCADGPSGIRMDCGTIAFAMPNGTCLACSFNDALCGELYEYEGLELRKNKVDTLLGPGINLHRNPLNGRNFEYFSEDPLLTGKMAVAQLLGMQKYSVTGTIKHFACNSQEHSRNFANAVVSERALRELYLKGFELAVREGEARSIMSSYGPINGIWTAGNYDLLTTVLRKEWGFTGIVMTDWWAKANDEGQPASFQNTAAMVRAQNDLYMVTGDALSNSNEDNSMEKLRDGSVFRSEYVRSAANICGFLLQSPAYLRMVGKETELDRELQRLAEQEMSVTGNLFKLEITDEVDVDENWIDKNKGKSTTLEVTAKERGLFRMEFECRACAEAAPLAQINLSVFQDKQLAETVTLAGSDKEWVKKTVHFPDPLFSYTFFVKLFFGMSGMELRNIKIYMTKSMEEETRLRMKIHREQTPE